MIQANELRIGNYVLYLGHVRKIEGISSRLRSDIGYFEVEGLINPLKGFHISPITITEEILSKCLKPAFGCGYKFSYGLELLPYSDYNIRCYHLFDDNENPIGEKIQYVHQLQNVYAALEYKELQIIL